MEEVFMKSPKQAKPIMRKSSTASIEARVGQSGGGLCEKGCNLIPNPTAKAICLSLCGIL
jgi:hypothetical protein